MPHAAGSGAGARTEATLGSRGRTEGQPWPGSRVAGAPAAGFRARGRPLPAGSRAAGRAAAAGAGRGTGLLAAFQVGALIRAMRLRGSSLTDAGWAAAAAAAAVSVPAAAAAAAGPCSPWAREPGSECAALGAGGRDPRGRGEPDLCGGGMSGTVGTGKRCPLRRALGGCVRVWLSFSSAREVLEALGRVAWFFVFSSVYFWAEPVWGGLGGRGAGGDSPGELAAPDGAAGTGDLPEDACPAAGARAARGCGPGRGQGCAPAVRGGGRAPRTEDRGLGAPNSELSNHLLCRGVRGGGGGEDSGEIRVRGSNCDSAGLPGLRSHRLFTLLTFEAREVRKRKKVRNVVQVSLG